MTEVLSSITLPGENECIWDQGQVRPNCFCWTSRGHGKKACKQSPAHCCHSSFGWSKHAFTLVNLEKYQQSLCFSNPWKPLNLWDCVNATEISFLTFEWCQIRDLNPFFTKVFVRIRWIYLNHTHAGSEINAKITASPQLVREVTESLWISFGVWTWQVWRVCQLMALGINPEIVSRSCAVFPCHDNKSLDKFLTLHVYTYFFFS